MNVEERVKDLSYITGVINAMARSDDLDFCYTEHCLERMRERNITVSDLLFVLARLANLLASRPDVFWKKQDYSERLSNSIQA